MALQKNRVRIFVHGLGRYEIREVSPTPASDFSDVGYIKSATLNDESTMVDIVADDGNQAAYLSQMQKANVGAQLYQTSQDEIDLLKNSDGKVYAIRYSGLTTSRVFQYFCMEQAAVNPSVNLPFMPGERLLPLDAVALDQTLSYDVPLYYVYEAEKKMMVPGLKFFAAATNGKNYGAAQLLDISGFAYHGTISSDYANIWQTDGTDFYKFLQFDGAVDESNHGDVCDDDGTGDFALDVWVRVQAANGSVQEIMAKKSASAGNSAGWAVYRNASNQATFTLGSGSANVTVTSTATLLQNVWNHVGVAVDRNGNATVYVNGAVSGTPASVSAIGTGTNAENLYIGRDGTNWGQVDVAVARVWRWAAAGLPADIATYMSNHYNGEKGSLGL